MASPVFYSISPYGTETIETGSGNISITSGVSTFSVEQTGNIGVGVCVEYNSLIVYIAPNRIGFDSGSVEITRGSKIEDATSDATGIVRCVELTSGTWAGGDAAGWIYFEKTTGTFGNNNIINRIKPTTSNNIATVNGSIEGNIGNGNTEFVLKTATGDTPANQSSTDITSIHHEFASLSDFDAGFINSSHINNIDLTSADVVAFACCYYDHDDYTSDSIRASIDFGTSDVTRFLFIYTPVSDAESINSQRHVGIWDNHKYYLEQVNSTSNLENKEAFTQYEGLQVTNSPDSMYDRCFVNNTNAVGGKAIATSCIFRKLGIVHDPDMIVTDSDTEIDFINCIFHSDNTDCGAFNLRGTNHLYYCTISKFSKDGVERDGGTVTVRNCAVFNGGDDWDGTIDCDHCASDDANATTYRNGIDWDNESTDWENVFVDYVNNDYRLNNFTGTGAVIEQGLDVSSSAGIWRDIANNERGSSPDIGAFEYVSGSAGNNATITGTLSFTNGIITRKTTFKRTLEGAI